MGQAWTNKCLGKLTIQMEKNEIGSHEIEFLHEIDLKWIVVSNMKGNIYNL